MLNISYETHPEFYFDYSRGIDFLAKLSYNDYDYPDHKTIFHVYTDVRTTKELESIKSFLATQNLDKTRLIIWSDYSLDNNYLIKPYRDLVEIKIYNPEEEAKGTLLERSSWLQADDSKHYMKSGILRFLATHKYGGIWMDMDMVLLRDFKPILDQEWAYMWGSETDFYNFGPCAAMMNIHKSSVHSNLCMEEILRTRIGGESSTCLDHQLLAKVYQQRPFDVFPSTFFNTEWLMSKTDKPLVEKIETGWFINNNIEQNDLFLAAFSWHWHNSSNKDKKIEYGSKFDILQRRTHKMLKDKGIL